jgi:hypothetical protein
MRTNVKSAKKIVDDSQAVLRNKYWDAVLELNTERTTNSKGTFYVLNVKQGRKTTPEEKAQAMGLALTVRQKNVEFVGDADTEATHTAEPDARGGMQVG